MENVYKGFKKFVHTYCNILFVCACIMLALLTAFVTMEVIMRYFLNSPTVWSFEIDGYLYVAMVLFALGFAQREDKHMKMDLLTGKVSGKKKNVLYIILALLGLAYAFILCVFGWQYAHAALIKGTRANSTFRSPVWPSYMALPIGALGIGLQYIVEIIDNIRAIRNGGEDTK